VAAALNNLAERKNGQIKPITDCGLSNLYYYFWMGGTDSHLRRHSVWKYSFDHCRIVHHHFLLGDIWNGAFARGVQPSAGQKKRIVVQTEIDEKSRIKRL